MDKEHSSPAPGTHGSGAFAGSALFERTFTEAMTLVRETAAYLDGPGRRESRSPSRTVSLAYAGESMRLTTRLMQVVAWLLVQKAVHRGEITHEEAADPKYRLGEQALCEGKRLPGADRLPPVLLSLMERSERLYARVSRLDSVRHEGADAAHTGRVPEQLGRLEAAFTAHRPNPCRNLS